MAINNRSDITSTTNFKGVQVDAQAFSEAKASIEHNTSAQSERPWAQSYRSPSEVEEESLHSQQALRTLYDKQEQIEPDPSIQTANRNSLKLKGIY